MKKTLLFAIAIVGIAISGQMRTMAVTLDRSSCNSLMRPECIMTNADFDKRHQEQDRGKWWGYCQKVCDKAEIEDPNNSCETSCNSARSKDNAINKAKKHVRGNIAEDVMVQCINEYCKDMCTESANIANLENVPPYNERADYLEKCNGCCNSKYTVEEYLVAD